MCGLSRRTGQERWELADQLPAATKRRYRLPKSWQWCNSSEVFSLSAKATRNHVDMMGYGSVTISP